MSRAEALAGLTEVIAGHDFDNDRRHPAKGLYYCTCGEVIDVYIEKHHAAVALAWLEGHGWSRKEALRARAEAEAAEADAQIADDQYRVGLLQGNLVTRSHTAHCAATWLAQIAQEGPDA